MMKELTIENWVKNPTPREMWVWDDSAEHKRKEKVVYIKNSNSVNYPVIVVNDYTNGVDAYAHCAEIEEEKSKRPCTGEELLDMLKKQGLQFLKSRKAIFNIVTVSRISTSSVEMSNGDYYPYKHLCESYTLLDGTELWKED